MVEEVRVAVAGGAALVAVVEAPALEPQPRVEAPSVGQVRVLGMAAVPLAWQVVNLGGEEGPRCGVGRLEAMGGALCSLCGVQEGRKGEMQGSCR